jgi:hypothetical protein
VWWTLDHATAAASPIAGNRTALLVGGASATGIVLGGQTILMSFLFSLFGIRRRFGPLN